MLDNQIINALEQTVLTLNKLNIEFVLVGATARDILAGLARKRDGADLNYLLLNSLEFTPSFQEEVFSPKNETFLLKANHDPIFASISLLGKRLQSALDSNSLKKVQDILEVETKENSAFKLVGAMLDFETGVFTEEKTEKCIKMLEALLRGLHS